MEDLGERMVEEQVKKALDVVDNRVVGTPGFPRVNGPEAVVLLDVGLVDADDISRQGRQGLARQRQDEGAGEGRAQDSRRAKGQRAPQGIKVGGGSDAIAAAQSGHQRRGR